MSLRFARRLRAFSIVTVKTKSGSVSKILVTNVSSVGIVISGRRAVSAGPQIFHGRSRRPDY
jgi:hypothetical protein